MNWAMFLCRVALINYGEEYGKLVVITDVVDQNRVCSHFIMIGPLEHGAH